jgi:2',3'-cyclic-nucleotide 2'-phosphodiesterase
MNIIRAAMIGDIVGSQGLETLEARLPALIKEHNLNLVTVNGENAAEGFGITEREYRRIIQAGADVVTSGNHVWEKREFWPFLESEKNLLRPANYPASAPGAGFTNIEKDGVNWIVVNLQGREFISAIDCPFLCFDKISNTQTGAAKRIIIVDFHAESSKEKEAFGYYADGRASLIAGTHTHVQTADERILPKGSAYITDIGMTGTTDSVIGMDIKICQERFRRQVQYQMKTAGSAKMGELQGVIAEIDLDTGTAVGVKRIAIK